ncbi:MAG TPA: hypothetical protein VK716_13315 [Terracidiphilus sp.]|jgi:hypothetical protein|nr:hypothetical protein [Terracidiphilus sp.]
MQGLSRFILLSYRMVAIAALYAVLVGVLGYVALLAFYTVSTSWIAPTTVVPSDLESLGVEDKIVASQNALANLALDVTREELSVGDFNSQRSSLLVLEPILARAIQRTRSQNHAIGDELDRLGTEKQANLAQTGEALRRNSILADRVQKDLAAGLITRTEAAQEEMQLNQMRNSLTDGKIDEVVLRGTVLDKQATAESDVDALAKQVELRSKVATLDMEIVLARKEMASDQSEIDEIKHAMNTVRGAPYFEPANRQIAINLAFVPFANQGQIRNGAPVYDCYLNFVACRYVGSVAQVFPNEEKLQNPIFKTDMRGFLVQLDLNDPRAARSKTLFVGSKPLGI